MKKKKISISILILMILLTICSLILVQDTNAGYGGCNRFVTFAHLGYDGVCDLAFDHNGVLIDEPEGETQYWRRCDQVMCVHTTNTEGAALKLKAIIDINRDGNNPSGATITTEDGTYLLSDNYLNKKLAAFAYYVENTNCGGKDGHCHQSNNFVAAKQPFIGEIWEGSNGYRDYVLDETGISLPSTSVDVGYGGAANSFAEAYADNPVPDVAYTARIFVFRSGGAQSRVILFGKESEILNKPEINKYISSVTLPDGTILDVGDRSGYTENEKLANPVMVLPGSTIEYTIVIGGEGEDSFTVEDYFDTDALSYYSSSRSLGRDLEGTYYVGDSFTVTLTVDDDVGSSGAKYPNTAAIPDYNLESSDYIEIEYEEEIVVEKHDASGNYQKYITKVTKPDGTEIKYNDDRKDLSNSTAQENPVLVEKGDIVTYELEVTNTSEYDMKNVKVKDTLEAGLEYNGSSGAKIILIGDIGSKQTESQPIEVVVTKSNMYLLPLENKFEISSGKYIDYEIEHIYRTILGVRIYCGWRYKRVEKAINLNWFTSTANADYVQHDDPEIAGDVWLDKDKDGLKDSSEALLSGIPVKLYQNGSEYKTTTTNENGHYSFGKVPKGDKPYPDGLRKYADDSGYYSYYVMFEYNGVQYKATTFTGATVQDGLKDTGVENNWNNKSHAQEQNRILFDKSLETIAYNKAYAGTTRSESKKDLEYDKSGHVSTLKWTEATTMRAKSIDLFVKLGSTTGTDTIYADHIEYLRHINLGLIEKEQGDLSLKKDVISAVVTINGYTSTYNYGKYGTGIYTGEYKLATPYVLSIYRGDYDFRANDYPANLKSSSDNLNITLTYRVTLKNESNKYTSVVREVIDISSDSLDLKTISSGTIANTSSYNSETSYSYSGYQVHYINMNTSLAPNAEAIFDLVYTVKKNDDAIILGTKANMAQIGAYSIYENNQPAGVVDKDSNPGIVNPNVVADITNDSLYEDHCYYTSIIIKDTPPTGTNKLRRKITGNVWEDLNTTTVSQTGQKTGDGKKNSNEEGAQNVTVVLLEVVKHNGTEYLIDTGLSTETNENGDYTLMSSSGIDRIHAGEYVVRFIYGDEASEFVTTTGDTIRFSGQDYKSTTYTPVGNSTNDAEVVDATAFAALKASQNAQVSVARDDEIRRLEVINYSTQMTYKLDSILKAHDNDTKKAELAANTSMFADTKVFNVQIEKVDNNGVNVINSITENVDGTKTYTYTIGEINFGLIERPITKLELMDDIKEITAITTSGEEILHIYFDISYKYNSSTKRVEKELVLNEALSVGDENVQILDRTSSTKGFRYVNIDSDLLQGMKIIIKYQFAIGNIGDIDTSNQNLIEMVKDYNLDETITKLNTTTIDTRYKLGSGSGINTNLLKNTTFDNVKNAVKEFKITYGNYRTMINGSVNDKDYDLGYFLGNKYYGTYNATTDKIVETRVDQIVSYVDNDLVFAPEENVTENGIPKFLTYSSKEIEKYELLKDVTEGNASTKLVDGEGVSYITEIKNNLAFNMEDASVNGGLYKYLTPLKDETTLGTDKLYIIELIASRVLASELDVENVVLDNLTEIVKISNTVGRKAYIEFIDTQTGNIVTPGPSGPTGYLGNTPDIIEDPDEDTVGKKEIDTNFTETVTFSPPTGLSVVEQKQKTISTTVVIVLIIIVIVGSGVGVAYIIERKKFYK